MRDWIRKTSNAMIAYAVSIGAACLLLVPTVQADNDLDCPVDPHHGALVRTANPDCGQHNMMLVGEQGVYLSHLPMFDREHRFQVITEATFDRGGNGLDQTYLKDRKAHPETRMYTVMPTDSFVLARLFSEETSTDHRKAFSGNVFRGHLERPGHKEIDGLQNIEIRITRVIYARELPLDDVSSDQLSYILFGKDGELFLAHQITKAPDFDQIIAVKINGHSLTENELSRGKSLTIRDRGNTAAQRLRPNEHVGVLYDHKPIQLEIGKEFYFEEGELGKPKPGEDFFKQTPLEKEAGF